MTPYVMSIPEWHGHPAYVAPKLMLIHKITGPAGMLMVDAGGRGDQPVVFAHSLAGNSRHWQFQLDHLRTNRQAVGFDFRGHGRSSTAADDDYSISGMAADIAAVVDTFGFDHFVLVGHSMGAGAALLYAAAHPARVAGLLLVDPIGDGKQISAAEAHSFMAGFESNYDNASRNYWTQIAGPDNTVQNRLLADLRATPPEVVVAVLRSVMRFDPDPALARYQGPMLSVVTPNNDQPFSLHRLGKGFPHQVVSGTGHWIQLDRPDELNRQLDEFLDTVSGKR
ncbi:MAG TPA: alpha/beta hydrolase [Gemmatimonadales bacterium]|nr:alpha/beta hydrolase [Gemmatimonadales bacterium]